ncbi:MAG: cell surface protein SprA [Balneolales bacterium]|nr:cell surface protein SprA [Balneolales bacterium]
MYSERSFSAALIVGALLWLLNPYALSANTTTEATKSTPGFELRNQAASNGGLWLSYVTPVDLPETAFEKLTKEEAAFAPGLTFSGYPIYDASMDTLLSSAADTLQADTLLANAPDTTFRSHIRGPQHTFSPVRFPRQRSRLAEIPFNNIETTITRDSLGNFRIKRELRGIPIGYPVELTFDEFAARERERSKQTNWARVVQESQRRQDIRRGLLDFRINIPGGQRSAFTTIFGRPEVNLRVTGTANMNLGVSIQETADPAVPPDQQRRVDPTFNQNLRLNIQGTIGDKLNIRTDWDTERTFNFENRVSIVYTGYEDEILQSVELGNVSMDTGNSLVRGGGALFGIKSRFQLGPLELTGIVSQQEGNSESQTVSGGSTDQQFDIRPNAYEDNRHFFIDFFARQEFEASLADPTLTRRLFNITNIEVWVLNETLSPQEGQRNAVALLDYGTRQELGQFLPPNEDLDPFDQAFIDQFRPESASVSSDDFGVPADEFASGIFVPLREGVDYTLDEALGYISLSSPLSPRQALAISFSYRDPQTNQIIYVGDVNQGDTQRLFLKLLRPIGLTPSSRAWPLTMRNIYSLNSTNLTRDGLELNIFYTQGTQEQFNLPGFSNVLLQDLGLDRVGSQGQLGSDNQVDFGTGTLNSRDGRIVFPYLEPFGQRIVDIINSADLPEAERQDAIDRLAFRELYTTTRTNAGNSSKNNIYRIRGTTSGGVSDSYFLGFQLVQGSVRVLANGRELTEGLDYEVDYSLGNILITNRSYLAPGQEIRIDYESNQFLQIQQTTFTGLRAEYTVSPDIRVGSTLFRQKDRPLQDKIPVGEEPINNAVIGFDARARFDAPWITRTIDRIPLLQTRAESSISFTGEFAQIRPGVAQTNAVQRAIDRGILYPDEERGVSFLDDFEGSKNSVSFMSPGRWHLAAAPFALPHMDADMRNADQSIPSRIVRSDHRGKFSWYTLPVSLGRITDAARTVESLPVLVTDVFPDRDVLTQDNILQTLDVHFDPRQRGPYNYNMDLRDLLENRPEETWGGFTTTLPSGLDDLTQNNIEFLEFWVQPILPDGRQPSAQDFLDYAGTLYFDIGVVSEDVIPNNENNTEDGLAERSGNLRVDQFGRSYIYRNIPDLDGQFSQETIALEDVGLDGAPNEGGIDGLSEQVLFADFLNRMRIIYADDPEMLAKIEADPSNDDFVYFDNPSVRDLPLHQRFHRMFGFHEGNAQTGEGQRAVTNRPDSEGLINPAFVNTENAFFQYRVPFNPADTTSLQIGQNYIIDKVDGDEQWNRWYQVRIPLRDFVERVGNIENLQRVTHLRMWMTGYREPFTMRFATLELVGNQWRKAEEVGNEGNTNTIFEIATINIEENSNRRPVPYRVPEGAIRSVNRGQQQEVLANEQSLLMRVEDLRAGDVRLIKRGFPMGLNLTNYSNMRMFVHGEGYSHRNDIELVVRLGSDIENNYYEYRQPITPTDTLHNFSPGLGVREDIQAIWIPEENSMNLVLGALNELKQLRNDLQADPSQPFERMDIVRGAPPGTVLAIVGEPSLNRITEIGIGIRNPFAPESQSRQGLQQAGTPSLDAEVWVNELRVSGFEDESGWAANLRSQVVLADFANINATLNRSTDGFGPIDSQLGNRQNFDRLSYDLTGTINMHRFIPERFGWNIPVTLSARQNTQTPRFLPREGDIRFEDFRRAVRANESLTGAEQDAQIAAKLREIQTYSESYSINLSNISKRFSRTRLGQYTLDNTRFNYVYNTRKDRDFRTEFNDNWNYTTGVNYNLNVRNVRTVRPFGFLADTPFLRYLDELQFAYLPSSVTAGATLNRSYGESATREFQNNPSQFRQQHNFTFANNFSLNYNVLSVVSLSYSNTTNQDLALIAQDSIPGGTNYVLRNSFDVLGDVFSDDTVRPRRSDYSENFTATWRPRLNKFNNLRWLNYSASYRGGFRWTNSSLGSGLGANLTNQYSLDQNPSIRTQDLLRKIPIYDRAFRTDEAERRAREQERNRLRQQRQREREQRAAAQNNAPEQETRSVAARRGNQQQQPVQPTERTLNENLTYYGRRAALSLLSFQNLDMTYSHSVQAAQQGYAGGSSMWTAFDDDRFSPSFGYRIGLNSRIQESQLIRSPSEQVTLPLNQSIRTSDDFRVRTTMQPIRDITIALDWNNQFDRTTQNTLTAGVDNITAQENQSGNITSSVWAFGGGYESFFRRQLQTAFDDMDGSTNIVDRNEDGRVVLGTRSLQEDFRRSYVAMSDGGRGAQGFSPLPLPNWRITWSGWERRIRFLEQYLNRASLTHVYTGRYRLGWQFNPDFGLEQNRSVGVYRALDERPEFQPNTINVERQFNPLLGVQLTWKSGLGTDLQYSNSRVTSFSLSNTNVVENKSQSLRFTARYSKRGFTLPFFPRLQNTLDMSLTVAYVESLTLTYRLNQDIQEVLSQPIDPSLRNPSLYTPQAPNERGDIRIDVTPLIGYQFSQSVKANLEYRYSQLIPKSTGVFPRTTQDIRVSVIVSIRSN